MAEVKWTPEQQKVIDLRKRNILVSAAAGSGKTAVLVERIITMITEGDTPIDIDHLLIVTFTNAAAAEMKERIGKAIEKKMLEQPDNVHLQKQMALIHNAQITTIHSFCLNVIRNHFNVIDLDPGFRLAEEAELKLLQSDVISNLLEIRYEEGNADFIQLVESYSSGKSDAKIEEIVLQLYHFSISYPWPLEWLESRKGEFSISTKEELEQADWMKYLLRYLKAILGDLLTNTMKARAICMEVNGPYPYEEAIMQDEDFIRSLMKQNTYQEFLIAFDELSFSRLSAKRDSNIAEEKKEAVKSLRDKVKKCLSDIRGDYFFQPISEMVADIMGVSAPMNALIDLTMEFSQEYAKQKEERNVIDFNDLEHFALNILVQKENEVVTPTLVANEFSEYYEEILIDEYQDSNLVQETILTAISKERYDRPNLFMVGDVKQSIYKFRMARPELFMEKFENYTLEDSTHQRIDLHKNFRSRAVVLDSVNKIFRKIMVKELGNIKYDASEELNVGATFMEAEENTPISMTTELILTTDLESEEVSTEGDSLEDYTIKELEAKAVANRIKELTDAKNGMMVLDNGRYRTARYGDIVILFRTMSGWSDVFVDTLMTEGIPAYAQTQSGYFSTIEIKTILNLLKVIDNPRQDIPLTAVLHSPMVGLSSEALAHIKAGRKKLDMYESVRLYMEEGEQVEIAWSLKRFIELLEELRQMVPYTPIYDLIQTAAMKTGYYHYVKAMPGGNRRVGNIDMLIQRAIDFETTIYHGLFDFNRYIEKLQRFEIDFGEAVESGEHEEAVRIMSIHKSKGLEFPVVIVAGIGKNFNNQDARSKLVLHPDLGLGPEYINETYRVKAPTLIKKVLQRQVLLENLGEELRVLYVALTRAKEKLILSGYVKKLVKQVGSWYEETNSSEEVLSYQQLTKAVTYLDWILPTVMNQPIFEYILNDSLDQFSTDHTNHSEVEIKIVDAVTLVGRAVANQMNRGFNQDDMLNWDSSLVYDEGIKEELHKRFTYVYPYHMETMIHSKMTVSELKKLGQMVDEEYSENIYEDIIKKDRETKETEVFVPRFACLETEKEDAGKDRVSAAYVGTLYHKVLECIDLTKVKTMEEIKLELEKLVISCIIKTEDVDSIHVESLFAFLQSDLAQRMAKANKEGKLYREQQFVIGVPSNQVNPLYESEALVLVQGIIDAYFEEDGELVLVDYKTDHVYEERVLVKRYQVQLDYYQKALEQLTDKQVKESVIYSFALNKSIKL